jgi:peptide chain release factor 2
MAMRVLKARLYEVELRKRDEKRKAEEGEKKDIDFGSQIRSYVLQPYRLIKDHRTGFEVGDVDRVLDGDLDPFIRAFLLKRVTPATTASSQN